MPSTLVGYKYSIDNHLPSKGEIIVVRLSEALSGPGSSLGSARSLPSHATRHNYHHAVVIDLKLNVFESTITLTVLPMPAYSGTDPTTRLSSTSWLLSQSADYQKWHIPVPYEQTSPDAQPHPPYPTPAQFGPPITVGGWKNRKPSWIQVEPMLAKLNYTTRFKCYDPPVKLSGDELRRLEAYRRLLTSPLLPGSGTMPRPQGGGSAAPGAPDTSLGKDTVSGSGSSQQQSQDSGNGGTAFGGGGSSTQALYANDAGEQALHRGQPVLIIDSDEDDEDDADDDDDWEDNMDPISFARYYAAQSPHLAKIVQDHDDKMRERLAEGVSNWVREIQS